MESPQSAFNFDISVERSAEFLVERYGSNAFDFAARQVALLHLAAKDTRHWCAIAMAIANKVTRH